MSDASRPVLLQNIRSRLIAFLLALVTWYVVHGAISHEHEITDIPITISLSSGWAVLDRSADVVSVRFRGSREDIRSLESQAIQVILDIRGEEFQGTRTIDIRPQDVKAPGSARPLKLRPMSIEITLDRESEKTVPVKADLAGELPPGVEMSAVLSRPAVALISGPQTLLANIEEVRTVPVDLKRRVKSFEERVDLSSIAGGRNIRIEPASVILEMKLIQRTADVTLEEVPIRTLKKPGQTSIIEFSPSVVKVVLSGDPEELEDLQKSQVMAYVDCADVEIGATYELPIRVHVPSRMTITELSPPVVSAVVKRAATAE